MSGGSPLTRDGLSRPTGVSPADEEIYSRIWGVDLYEGSEKK